MRTIADLRASTARYASKVNAAIDFAQTDEQYLAYRARGLEIAASIHLADHFGTWIAFDARKVLGHAFF